MQKKRKAQEDVVEPQPRLSAFAAAKARAAQLQADAVSADTTAVKVAESRQGNDQSRDPTAIPALLSSSPLSSAHEAASEDDDDDNGVGYSSDDQLWTESSVAKSYKASQPRQLSTFRPSKTNVLSDSPGRLVLKVRADETVALIGEYDLQVVAGIIVVAGAAFQAGDRAHRVYAPSTHALPTIVAKGGAAEIAIISTETSLAGLSKLSPLWGRIWNARDAKDGNSVDSKTAGRSFMLLRSSSNDPLKRALTALEVEQDVQSSLFRIMNSPRTSQPPVVLVSGPKASGKSTISRWLTNTYLTSISTNTRSHPLSLADPPPRTSFWLDLDPGQPEFSAPGQVTLLQLHAPILGPPFTHPAADAASSFCLIRSHTLASITPKEDSAHFLSCAMDLLSHYQRLRLSYSDAPLIINCSGWVLGSAVEVLLALVQGFPVTDVVLMQPMDADVVQAIQNTLQPQGRVLLIPQRDTKPTQSRTSAEFRAMMGMSYFHSLPLDISSLSTTETGDSAQARTKSELAKCNALPLSHHNPWRVSYSSSSTSEAGIFAIASYGEPPPPAFLSTILNTSVVAICVVEDFDTAFPSSMSSSASHHNFREEGEEDQEYENQNHDTHQDSLIGTTPDGLPYLLPDSSGLISPLDPRTSRCLGLALIRGIDVQAQELHLLTPVSRAELAAATSSPQADDEDEEAGWQTKGRNDGQETKKGREGRKKRSRIVLVRGKFDPPDWALLEDVHYGTVFSSSSPDGEDAAQVEMPYVAARRVDAERGLGENVWRVRHLPRKIG